MLYGAEYRTNGIPDADDTLYGDVACAVISSLFYQSASIFSFFVIQNVKLYTLRKFFVQFLVESIGGGGRRKSKK